MKKGKLYNYYSKEGLKNDINNQILKKKEFWAARDRGFTGLSTYQSALRDSYNSYKQRKSQPPAQKEKHKTLIMVVPDERQINITNKSFQQRESFNTQLDSKLHYLLGVESKRSSAINTNHDGMLFSQSGNTDQMGIESQRATQTFFLPLDQLNVNT